MSEIAKGTPVEVVDAVGRTFSKRALSAPQHVGRFPAVWACSEDEWTEAEHQEREPVPEPFPWPLRSVRVAEHVG